MGELYPAIKHSHMLLVAFSIILFNLRYWLRFARPERPLAIVWRALPPVNDSLLLFSGMLMMQIIPWQPFGANAWLGSKFGLIILYIVFGLAAMKSRPRSGKAHLFYALAIATVLSVVYLARVKPL